MSDVKWGSVGCVAASIARDASAAYWDDGREEFHARHIDASFREMASALGYDVSLRKQPVTDDDVRAAFGAEGE